MHVFREEKNKIGFSFGTLRENLYKEHQKSLTKIRLPIILILMSTNNDFKAKTKNVNNLYLAKITTSIIGKWASTSTCGAVLYHSKDKFR